MRPLWRVRVYSLTLSNDLPKLFYDLVDYPSSNPISKTFFTSWSNIKKIACAPFFCCIKFYHLSYLIFTLLQVISTTVAHQKTLFYNISDFQFGEFDFLDLKKPGFEWIQPSSSEQTRKSKNNINAEIWHLTKKCRNPKKTWTCLKFEPFFSFRSRASQKKKLYRLNFLLHCFESTANCEIVAGDKKKKMFAKFLLEGVLLFVIGLTGVFGNLVSNSTNRSRLVISWHYKIFWDQPNPDLQMLPRSPFVYLASEQTKPWVWCS